MGKKKHGMLITLEKTIERLAGEKIMKKVMIGSEEITEKTDRKKKATWMKGAMDTLDELVDEDTRFQIMENCGYHCAEVNKKVIENDKARRKKYKTENEFIEAEIQMPMKGTRLEREGDTLYLYYTPQSFGVKCYCELVQAAEGKVSLTYCHCSKGFVKKLWEAVLERPVEVNLVQSVISGAKECKFVIHL